MVLVRVHHAQNLADECAAHIVPVIKHAVEDRSWRVRCAMARGFGNAAEAVGPKLTTAALLPSLTRQVLLIGSLLSYHLERIELLDFRSPSSWSSDHHTLVRAVKHVFVNGREVALAVPVR